LLKNSDIRKLKKFDMSDEELRDQITKIALEIQKVEDVAKQKENYITNKCNEEYDPKIKEIGEKLLHHQNILNDLLQKINELTAKKKELLSITKKLESEYNNLEKEKQKFLNFEKKAIEKEKKTKTKSIDNQIKILEKELKSLEKD